MYLKLGVQGNHFPAGEIEGQRPSRFWLFKRPCEDTKGSTKDYPPNARRGTTNPRRGVGGKGGSAPDRRENVKTDAPRLTFASATPISV
jgi:hypothetical protein